MKKFKYLLTGAVILMASATADAQLAGKNVLLIHGFQSKHILTPPTDEGVADSIVYWEEFEPALKDPATTRILHWPSHYRLPGAGGIGALITSEMIPILESGFCDDQCIVITHSTGDLVARYILGNKQSLFGSLLANRFKVAAVIDLAGAGGGTDLANLAVDLVEGINADDGILGGMLEFLGFDIRPDLTPGVLVDLQPSVARNTAVNNIPTIPRLRVAATGDEDAWLLTHALIKGGDDSVVPLHSACGAAYDGAYDSCVKDLHMNGRVDSVENAPSLSQLYDYHYPIILSESISHNGLRYNTTGNDMTFALSAADYYDASAVKSINVAVEYETVEAWWDWFQDYRYITGANEKTMGQVIVDSFE